MSSCLMTAHLSLKLRDRQGLGQLNKNNLIGFSGARQENVRTMAGV
jgi:hypothetical protein